MTALTTAPTFDFEQELVDAEPALTITEAAALVWKHGRRRDRSITWETVAATFPDGREHMVTVTAAHWADRKCFAATITRQVRTPAGPGENFAHVEYVPTSDCVTFEREPVARFAQKKLEAFADHALAEARRRLAADLSGYLQHPSEIADRR